MAINPYPFGSPQYRQFEQLDLIARQQEEQANQQAAAAAEQQRLLQEQNDRLWEAVRPQRQRQAVLDEAKRQREEQSDHERKQQIAKWMSEAPGDVRKAVKEIQFLQQTPIPKEPISPKEVGAGIWLGIVLTANCGGIAYTVAGKIGGGLSDSQVGFIVIPLLLILLTGIPAILIVAARTRASTAKRQRRIELEQDRQAIINDYIGRRTAAHEREKALSTPSESASECPFCRETIKAGAKKCRHCGELLC